MNTPTYRLVIFEEACAEDTGDVESWYFDTRVPFVPRAGQVLFFGFGKNEHWDVKLTDELGWFEDQQFFHYSNYEYHRLPSFPSEEEMEAHYRGFGFVRGSEFTEFKKGSSEPLDWAYIEGSLQKPPAEVMDMFQTAWMAFDRAECDPDARDNMLAAGAGAFRRAMKRLMRGHADLMAEIAAEDARNGVAA